MQTPSNTGIRMVLSGLPASDISSYVKLQHYPEFNLENVFQDPPTSGVKVRLPEL